MVRYAICTDKEDSTETWPTEKLRSTNMDDNGAPWHPVATTRNLQPSFRVGREISDMVSPVSLGTISCIDELEQFDCAGEVTGSEDPTIEFKTEPSDDTCTSLSETGGVTKGTSANHQCHLVKCLSTQRCGSPSTRQTCS